MTCNHDCDCKTDSASDKSRHAERQAEYEEMIDHLDATISEARHKLDGEGRIRDSKKEHARTRWANSLIRAVRERADILEQMELSELHRKVERLQQQQASDAEHEVDLNLDLDETEVEVER